MEKISSSISDGITFRKAEGALTAADIISAIEQRSPTPSTGRIVWDFTNAYAKYLSTDDLKMIAEAALAANSHRPAEDKTAVIFASGPDIELGQEIGKYLEMNGLHYQFQVFSDIHDAMIWLYTEN